MLYVGLRATVCIRFRVMYKRNYRQPNVCSYTRYTSNRRLAVQSYTITQDNVDTAMRVGLSAEMCTQRSLLNVVFHASATSKQYCRAKLKYTYYVRAL